VIRCENGCIEIEGRQLTISQTAGLLREQRDQFISTRYVKPPWSTNPLVHTAFKIKHHDVVSSGIFANEFSDKHPCEWTKLALTAQDDPTNAFTLEVIAECDM